MKFSFLLGNIGDQFKKIPLNCCISFFLFKKIYDPKDNLIRMGFTLKVDRPLVAQKNNKFAPLNKDLLSTSSDLGFGLGVLVKKCCEPKSFCQKEFGWYENKN